jgi:uncharacterized protein (TIGR01777 family)
MKRITVTGATGLIGTRLVAALRERGDEVTVLSRRPEDARRMLGVEAVGWRADAEPAPVDGLAGREGVVHLAGESIAQRWTGESRERIRSSRELGTARLVEGLEQSEPRPRVLVSASAVGYYGARGDERLDEEAPPGTGFLASVCEAWEHAAAAAARLGVRVATLRTGVLLDRADGGLARMLPPFRLGVGGPVAGGHQYISWIAPDDLVRMYLAALDNPEWSGPFNATAPEPVTNRTFARELGRVLHRPALLPIPAFAVQVLYGEMAGVVTTGQRALPVRAIEQGFEFRHATIDGALRAALARPKPS